MKPGLYEAVNAKVKPHIIVALEGRRVTVKRAADVSGFNICVKRARKCAALSSHDAARPESWDMSANIHTKRTSAMFFSLSDEAARALRDALIVAIEIHERKTKEDAK